MTPRAVIQSTRPSLPPDARRRGGEKGVETGESVAGHKLFPHIVGLCAREKERERERGRDIESGCVCGCVRVLAREIQKRREAVQAGERVAGHEKSSSRTRSRPPARSPQKPLRPNLSDTLLVIRHHILESTITSNHQAHQYQTPTILRHSLPPAQPIRRNT